MPTVERGLWEVVFWSIEIAGDNPEIESTSGFSIPPKNCLAYALKDSTNRLCPSLKIVSNAKVDLPLPLNPVKTTKEYLGISKSIFFKLFSLAPLTNIVFFSIVKLIVAKYQLLFYE